MKCLQVGVELFRTVFWGRITNFNQSEVRKQRFLALDWLKCENFPENTLLYTIYFNCRELLQSYVLPNFCLVNQHGNRCY